MVAEGSSTPASDAASNKVPANIARVPASPQLVSLPPPSSPSSVLRRKMASSAPKKDPVPPRRPAAASSSAAPAARRPAAASTTNTSTRPPSSASKALDRSTSRLAGAGSSLNKPPTRAPVGTTARRTALGTKAATGDAEPDRTSVISGDENKKPAVRRSLAGATAAGRATPSERRSTIAPTTTAAKRPSTTSRLSTESTNTRATPRASLPASTPAKPATSRPSINTRTPHHVVPKAPVSTITPKTPVAHAKKLSINSVNSPTRAAPAEALTYVGSPLLQIILLTPASGIAPSTFPREAMAHSRTKLHPMPKSRSRRPSRSVP